MPKIILIAPAFNEEGKVGKVVSKVRSQATVDEILVVDDGSSDNTYWEAKEAGAKVIKHSERKGVGAAIRLGIDYALSNNFNLVIVMGGDDQDDPREIPIVLKPILEKDFDFVQGSRYLGGERTLNIPLFRRVTTKVYAILFKLFTGFPSTDSTNGFRAFKTSIFQNKKINLRQDWLNTYELEPYLFYQAVRLGFKVCEAPVTKAYHHKKIGYTKMTPLIDWWRILRPIIFLKLGIKK